MRGWSNETFSGVTQSGKAALIVDIGCTPCQTSGELLTDFSEVFLIPTAGVLFQYCYEATRELFSCVELRRCLVPSCARTMSRLRPKPANNCPAGSRTL